MSKNVNLSELLANNYALLIKTQCYHWNVTGQNFLELHKLFEEQYNDLFSAIDTIAERIRILGDKVAASFDIYKNASSISAGNENFSAGQMIDDLIQSNKKLHYLIKSAMQNYRNDEVTIDMLIERLASHDKNVWFLTSLK